MKYSEYKKQLTEKTKAGSSAFSATALAELTDAAFNDATAEIKTYAASGDSYTATEANLNGKMVSGLKKYVASNFGISNAELAKCETATIPKDITGAIADWARIAPAEYTSTGKNLRLQATAPDQFVTQLYAEEVDEKTEATNKPVQKDDGSWGLVPTGKVVTTKKHVEVKASRVAMPWLKIKKDA